MMWFVLACLVCLARSGEGVALRCAPGSTDALCATELSPDHRPVQKRETLREGRECLPESTWRSECSECRCSAEGYAVCSNTPCDGKLAPEPKRSCAPETRWKNDCNTCWCSGPNAACTLIGCLGKLDFGNFFKRDESVAASEPVAVTVSDHKITHNDEEHTKIKRSVCKANENFQSECNTCKCAADGQSYRCTENECLERDMDKEVEVFMESEGVDHIERHSVCKPRDVFYIGCNTCICNFDGTDYSCTNKPCPLPADVEIFHELKPTIKSSKNKTQVCVANRMFIKDCNTCWCNEDGTSYFCTRKVCVPELPEESPADDEKKNLRIIKKECRPDEVFEIDCNMCRCNPDGKSFSCTRRACVDQTEEEIKKEGASRKLRSVSTQETPKNCQPGKEFRLDCNKCLCDDYGQEFSCTRMDCNAMNNNNGGSRRKRETSVTVEGECVANSVFNKSCNACRCHEDGQRATCTNNLCTQLEEDNTLDGKPTVPESDSNFRCNPGEQFKKHCNDCTCSADGRGFFCTLRLCDVTLQ